MNTEDASKELLKQRSDDLPLAIYEVFSSDYHWHDEYEFLYAKEHTALCMVNGQQIVLEPGMGLLLQPGDLHTMEADSSSTVCVIVVHPSFWTTQTDRALFDGRLRFQSVLTPLVPQEKKILDLFESIVACYQSKDYGYEFVLKVLISSVFAHMLSQHMYKPNESAVKQNESVFPALLAHVHQNYMYELSLESLVRNFHYSKSYIIRLFRQNTNMTPVEYINRYRIEKAKERLLAGTQSILKIAVECGFQNVSYFTRSFKKYTGLTPGVFRTQHFSKQEPELIQTEKTP